MHEKRPTKVLQSPSVKRRKDADQKYICSESSEDEMISSDPGMHKWSNAHHFFTFGHTPNSTSECVEIYENYPNEVMEVTNMNDEHNQLDSYDYANNIGMKSAIFDVEADKNMYLSNYTSEYPYSSSNIARNIVTGGGHAEYLYLYGCSKDRVEAFMHLSLLHTNTSTSHCTASGNSNGGNSHNSTTSSVLLPSSAVTSFSTSALFSSDRSGNSSPHTSQQSDSTDTTSSIVHAHDPTFTCLPGIGASQGSSAQATNTDGTTSCRDADETELDQEQQLSLICMLMFLLENDPYALSQYMFSHVYYLLENNQYAREKLVAYFEALVPTSVTSSNARNQGVETAKYLQDVSNRRTDANSNMSDDLSSTNMCILKGVDELTLVRTFLLFALAHLHSLTSGDSTSTISSSSYLFTASPSISSSPRISGESTPCLLPNSRQILPSERLNDFEPWQQQYSDCMDAISMCSNIWWNFAKIYI